MILSLISNNIRNFFVLIFILSAGLVSANTQIVKIEVEGMGDSLQLAIDRGLTEAMGRVNGRSVESEILSKNSEQVNIKDQTEEYLSSSEYQDQIKSKTKGVVDSYSVISSEKLDNNIYKVMLNVSVIKFKPSKSANRKRIAVLDLKSRNKCCRIGDTDINGIAISEELTAAISSYLVQTRKFTVLDRAYESQTNQEQDRLKSDNVPITELAKIGQELVADYVLVGTLNNFFLREQTRKLSTVDKSVTTVVGNAAISFRIIDVPTGQIKFSQTFKKDLGNDVKSISDPIQSALDSVTSISSGIGINILEAIYPFVIEKIEGQTVIVGTGGDVFKVGEKYRLIQYGNKVIDSYTKESLGRKENIIGMIEITEVTPKMAYGKILNSKINDLESIFKPKSFIIRSMPESIKKENNKKKQEVTRKEIEEEFDENW
tara:strand:- start:240 stop:1532 length:1293 start_codon:yes stop_codon:yes gene_type:complete